MRPTRVLPLLLLALAAAGAPLAAQSEGGGQKRDRYFIAEEEVRASAVQNVHDLVRNLRPQWLRMRGDNAVRSSRADTRAQTESTEPLSQAIVVYVDGVRYGSQADLRSIAAGDVATVQFLDRGSATQRWGTGHPNGAILVTRRSTQ